MDRSELECGGIDNDKINTLRCHSISDCPQGKSRKSVYRDSHLGLCACISESTCSDNVPLYSKPIMSALSICPHTHLMLLLVSHMVARVCVGV